MFLTNLGAGGSVVSYLGYIGQVMTRAMKSNRVGYGEWETWPGLEMEDISK